jgi:hypothetical protein
MHEANMKHPEPHDLTALAYALVPSPEREQLLEHIASCDACRETYDAAFEEQALVRDVMFEEVRSGEAETRALDRVLQALKTGEAVTEEKQGNVFSLFSPFAIGLQIAAALAIAVGVFYVAVVLPGNGATETPSGGAPRVETAAKDEIKVEGGDLLVATATDIEPDKATWTKSKAVPLGVWCRNDSAAPVSFTIEGADLSFNNGACFQLQPKGGQVSVYVLRGDASVTNSDQILCLRTNTNDFWAMPGSTFDVACDASFNYAERGREVPASRDQTVVSAEVSKGEVFYVPYGDAWESPRRGVVRAGNDVKIQSVTKSTAISGNLRVRLMHADGEDLDSARLIEALKPYQRKDPKGYEELCKLMAEFEVKLTQQNRSVSPSMENRLILAETNGRVTISDGKRSLVLYIDDKDHIVADVTINGETETYTVANLDELATKCPAVAQLIGAVNLDTPTTGKRSLSIKRVFYERQEIQEEEQRDNKQSSHGR